MLNKSKGNMYGFVTHTWNVIKGKCYHDCSYCYMKRFKQHPVRFDEKELKTDLGQGNFIFVGSSCDMFNKEIPNYWIEKIIDYCRRYDNKYLFQTKDPRGFVNRFYPKNTTLCLTLESNITYPEIMNNSPCPNERLYWFNIFNYYDYGINKMLTIEPILNFDLPIFTDIIKQIKPQQINIGADSKGHNLPEPSGYKLSLLIDEIKSMKIKLHLKPNLNRLLKE